MKVTVCLGEYAKNPYRFDKFGLCVYSIEELCFCLKENALFLDLGIVNDKLVSWIQKECELEELAKLLHPMVHQKGSLSAFVTLIQEYTGFYDRDVIKEIAGTLKQGSGLSIFEKHKSIVDKQVMDKKYVLALKGYDHLIAKINVIHRSDHIEDGVLLGKLWHNKGVVLAELMYYEAAAACFLQSYEFTQNKESYLAYLGAKRMVLSEKEYVAFVAEDMHNYKITLQLEERLKATKEQWENTTECMRIRELQKQRVNANDVRYNEEREMLVELIKRNYKSCVTE